MERDIAQARRALPVAQADRLTARAEHWENIRTPAAVIAEGERNACRLRGTMLGIKALSGGKGVFEVDRTLAGDWLALGDWT